MFRFQTVAVTSFTCGETFGNIHNFMFKEGTETW